MSQVYAEGFVTFMNINGLWQASFWYSPPDGLGPVYRIKVPVPEEVAGPLLPGEVEVNSAPVTGPKEGT